MTKRPLGWECPVCGMVNSPYSDHCWNCLEDEEPAGAESEEQNSLEKFIKESQKRVSLPYVPDGYPGLSKGRLSPWDIPTVVFTCSG